MKKLASILAFLVLLSCLFILVNCENKEFDDVPKNLQGTWTVEPYIINEGKENEAEINFTLHIYDNNCEQVIRTKYTDPKKEQVETKSIYVCHYFNGSLWIKTASIKANTINSTYIEAKVAVQGDMLEYKGMSYKKTLKPLSE
jgi:hypothetical protein